MGKHLNPGLTRRERLIMDILYRRGRVTATDVLNELPDSPSDSTVRTQLRRLEAKGYVRHVAEDLRYIYEPIVPRQDLRHSALAHMLETFFEGSAEQVVAALLGRQRVSAEELNRITEIVEKAKKRSRK
ncbi:MAG TPA: BlaI/MecI/CopY family transcriptional regulator [Terriglobia bacterium]|nr:BlaI/MecI/CopY family transcriptional regulator [Terriglobia bacterium]